MAERILALDVGSKTIGLALCERGVVLPLHTLERRSVAKDAAAITRLIQEKRVDTVVVGLPLTLEGEASRSTRLARQVGEAVGAAAGVPVAYQDEQYTTLEAQERLERAGVYGAAMRARIDAVAAAVILEGWLEAQASEARNT